jgi:hypothetical protein
VFIFGFSHFFPTTFVLDRKNRRNLGQKKGSQKKPSFWKNKKLV